jgi:hypothetical protein
VPACVLADSGRQSASHPLLMSDGGRTEKLCLVWKRRQQQRTKEQLKSLAEERIRRITESERPCRLQRGLPFLNDTNKTTAAIGSGETPLKDRGSWVTHIKCTISCTGYVFGKRKLKCDTNILLVYVSRTTSAAAAAAVVAMQLVSC